MAPFLIQHSLYRSKGSLFLNKSKSVCWLRVMNTMTSKIKWWRWMCCTNGPDDVRHLMMMIDYSQLFILHCNDWGEPERAPHRWKACVAIIRWCVCTSVSRLWAIKYDGKPFKFHVRADRQRRVYYPVPINAVDYTCIEIASLQKRRREQELLVCLKYLSNKKRDWSVTMKLITCTNKCSWLYMLIDGVQKTRERTFQRANHFSETAEQREERLRRWRDRVNHLLQSILIHASSGSCLNAVCICLVTDEIVWLANFVD